MWPSHKHNPAMSSSPLPVARPYTPPNHEEDRGPFSDYFSDPFSAATTPSPVQNALFSCLAHFEHLIQAAQPSEEQMEQILSVFEEMASILSQPEAQSRKSDDHLFPELDVDPPPAPRSASSSLASSPPRFRKDSFANYEDPPPPAVPDVYVAEVQSYIDGVRDCTQGLKTRLEEVKELNWIQGEIIADLRQQLRTWREASSKPAPEKETPVVGKEAPVVGKETPVVGKAQPRGFWAAVGEALDQVGDMLHEW
ncbi:hypothetical protein K505DRAFT_329998 [Melanomma pulvis-pyrius CBS 109.77]|uniref:Uncharacterized protein n=1 Tax=Melanomma pulvis-pyrius CBS 109.77 TaxID=1314802 RepID=A0A6A6WS65_9PLEO|nr:hypothetical protein K505DRAFT_329998 [Melanomma pulvis-pyrius CBS 109.77]